jgi:hypothetical protein
MGLVFKTIHLMLFYAKYASSRRIYLLISYIIYSSLFSVFKRNIPMPSNTNIEPQT